MARRKKTADPSGRTTAETVTSFKYSATRTNILPARLESNGSVREVPELQDQYSPHPPPVLRLAPVAAATDWLSELMAEARHRALSKDRAEVLEEVMKRSGPRLERRGKRESPWFVDTDYDARTFCILRASISDWSKRNPESMKKERFESLPFSRSSHGVDEESWRVAVKIIDPRGNEGLRILTVWG